VREFVRTVVRWSAAGAGLAAICGLVLLGVSVLGGRHVWAGMLLLAGVLSWPAGLWVIDPLTSPFPPGTRAAELAIVVMGPLMNGAVLGALLGCMAWVGGHRSRAPAAAPDGTA
jgi:hypothetical protein